MSEKKENEYGVIETSVYGNTCGLCVYKEYPSNCEPCEKCYKKWIESDEYYS